MWMAHSKTQTGSESIQHELMALAGLVYGLITFGSIVFPGSDLLQTRIWALLLLQGGWMFTIGAFIKNS